MECMLAQPGSPKHGRQQEEGAEQEESKTPLPFSPMADLKQEMAGRERKFGCPGI